MSRRLAAIMFTDLVGSTEAAQRDEQLALRWQVEQESLLRPVFVRHGGREIKSTGDGFLVEFDSALRATECAVDAQQTLRDRNSERPAEPLLVRIGIHLGDVEHRDNDIFGDAVNLASRIEPIAEPGGICLSAQVFAQVRNKVPFHLENIGTKALKGVSQPVEVYRVLLPWVKDVREAGPSNVSRLAVLPLANISPDPTDEYFAEGLTEELITVLSRIQDLRVIARTSVAQYKATTKPIGQIGAELGVGSVLEGSVRKSGNQLRITVQLIDVESQAHRWAETYDRELENVFTTQSEIAKQVAQSLQLKIRPAEQALLERRVPVRPESYLAYLRGRTFLYDFSESARRSAKAEFERAISLDPTNAAAYSGLSDAEFLLGWWYIFPRPPDLQERRRSLIVRALELDPNLAEAHSSLAGSLRYDYQYAAAGKEYKLAIALNPSYANAHLGYAYTLADQNRVEEALAELAFAEAADPRSMEPISAHADFLIELRRMEDAKTLLEKSRDIPGSGNPLHAAWANYHLALREFEQALAEGETIRRTMPTHPLNLYNLAELYAAKGDREQASALLRQLEPLYVEGKTHAQFLAEIFARLDELDSCFEWLRKAIADHSMWPHRWRIEPAFAKVRGDPRFLEILRCVNLA